MSATRAFLSIFQAALNQRSMTAPNPQRVESRQYNTDVPRIIAIAPLVFHIHAAAMWACALGELVSYLSTIYYPLPPTVKATSRITVTPIFLVGIAFAIAGTYMRLECFRALGKLYTFDLTIHPEHKLITSGPFYTYLRHPAYTASMLLVAGSTFSHFTGGSWLTECGPLRAPYVALTSWFLLWAWTLAVGLNRAAAEDAELKRVFGPEWEEWARATPSWFLPGIF